MTRRIELIIINFILFSLSSIIYSQNITINEVMFDPYGSDYYDEYIEIFNYGKDTVSLEGFKLSINGYRDSLISPEEFYLLYPKHYCIIMDRGYVVDSLSNSYVDIIPDTATILTINDNAFGKNGLKNSDSNYVCLINNVGDTISCVITTPNQESGYSDEKINPFESNTLKNWGNSQVINGTPGFQNSIMIKHRDLKLDSLVVSPSTFLRIGDSVHIYYKIINTGLDTIDEYYVNIDVKDALSSKEIYRQQKFYYQKLANGESLVGKTSFQITESGKLLIEVNLFCQNDEREENNFSFKNIFVSYPPKSLVINEVMYCPEEDEPEWIEIFNSSTYTINLENFKIKDASGKLFLISDSTLIISPGGYLALTGDKRELVEGYGLESKKVCGMERFPVLNNSGDSIEVIDCSGFIIDSLYYTKNFGYKAGLSIERRNPYGFTNDMSNWGLSSDPMGATPGKRNSIMRKEIDLGIDSIYVTDFKGSLSVGDSFKIKLEVKNYGLRNANEFDVRINVFNSIFGEYFDKIKTFLGLLKPDSSIEIEFTCNSMLSGVNKITANVAAEGDENERNNYGEIHIYSRYRQNSVVINEIMYDPNEDEPEWIEVYNYSEEIVDLAKWRIRDGGGKWKVITDSTFILQPDEYVVLAGDGNFKGSYPGFSGKVIYVQDFPILNNTSDSVFICDGTGNIIDKVFYKNQYGGGYGVSLERRDPNLDGLAGDNWGSCLDVLGATPGRANSILKYDYDVCINNAYFLDTIKNFGEQANFTIELKNVGRKATGFLNIEVRYDSNCNGVFYDDDIVWQLKNIPGLLPNSSTEISGKVFVNGKGYCSYQVFVDMAGDRYTENNYGYMNLYSKINRGDITINEFLAYPNEDQCEYVELYNLSDLPINLKKIILSSTLRKSIIGKNYKLNPGEYIVLSRDSSIFDSFISEENRVIIPSSWFVLNNYKGEIKLLGVDNEIIDYLSYNEGWGIKAGKSIEKKFPALPSQNRESWSLCIDPIGGTPGYQNSITPYQYDVCIDSLEVKEDNSAGKPSYFVTMWIKNVGLSSCNRIVSSIFKFDMDNLILVDNKTIDSLNSGDTSSVRFLIENLGCGINQFLAVLNCDEDLNSKNDTTSFDISLPFSRSSLLLTEFLIENEGSNPIAKSRFIEIYNSMENLVNLRGWAISDENKEKKFFIQENKYIYPDSFFVIAFDSTIFNFNWLSPSQVVVLNNYPIYNRDEDKIILFDPTGYVIDSLRYDKSWGTVQGISMERVSFNNTNSYYNWKLSKSKYGCTPGMSNSISVKIKMAEFGIKIYPNPFTPDGDGINDEAGIFYKIPFKSAIADVYIYDLFGRLISNVAKAQTVGSIGVVFWDGSSMYSEKARVGIYVVRLNAKDIKTGRKVGYISTVVLAGKL